MFFFKIFFIVILSLSILCFTKKTKMHFFFYEFRSNEYRRGFIEFKHRWCDFLNKDLIIGQFLAKYFPPCPQPKGVYEVRNVTFLEGQLLNQFPFRKGRIFLNVTYGKDNIRVGEGCIDMEIKQ